MDGCACSVRCGYQGNDVPYCGEVRVQNKWASGHLWYATQNIARAWCLILATYFQRHQMKDNDVGECWPWGVSYEACHVSRLEMLTRTCAPQLGRLWCLCFRLPLNMVRKLKRVVTFWWHFAVIMKEIVFIILILDKTLKKNKCQHSEITTTNFGMILQIGLLGFLFSFYLFLLYFLTFVF